MKPLETIAFSSFFIGLMAALLALFYSKLLNNISPSRIAFVGFATFFAYNLVQIIPFKLEPPVDKRASWIYKKRVGLITASIISFGLLLPLTFQFTLIDWLNYGHLFALCLFYEKTFGNAPLRKIPYMKSVIIAYVWTMACAFPPIYTSDFSNIWLLFECFFFIWALCILFDLRDRPQDLSQDLVTFATSFSPFTLKVVSFCSFFISATLLAIKTDLPLERIIPHVAVFAFLAMKLESSSSEFAYLLGIDGMIGLRLFLVV